MDIRLLVAMALSAGLPGCKSEKPEDPPPPMVLSTPMEFDPTEKHDLSGWWSDGTQMLRLNEPSGLGSYLRFADMNRYHEPMERGRWRQVSYAVLWLEPYSAIQREPMRVGVTKIDGRLALRVPGPIPGAGPGAGAGPGLGAGAESEPMFAMDGPPLVLEDQLLGRWVGAKGELVLTESMRYSFRVVRERQSDSAALAGHDGRWWLRGRTIVLQPDSSGIEPIEWPVNEENAVIKLGKPGRELRRPQQTDEDAGP